MHTFLFEEEDSRLQVLAQEVEVKVKVMSLKLEFIEKQMKSLASVIRDTERRLNGDDLSFLVVRTNTLNFSSSKVLIIASKMSRLFSVGLQRHQEEVSVCKCPGCVTQSMR